MRRCALLSLGLHAAALGGLLLWFYHTPPSKDAPDTQGSVELVMLEQQGSGATAAPPVPTPPTTAETNEEPPPAPPISTEPTEADEALPPPTPPPKQLEQANTQNPPVSTPPVQHAVEAPEINLGGTDSETNALVIGDNVVPARVDSKFHNKEPNYPLEAVRRAQQGSVILLIHVSPDGLAQGVDVEQSSGFAMLDDAARNAVEGWHFLPAVRGGQPVPFDMELRVLFHLE
jgi:periplasmic protein TonB